MSQLADDLTPHRLGVELLVDVARQRRSGELIWIDGARRCRIHFVAGRPERVVDTSGEASEDRHKVTVLLHRFAVATEGRWVFDPQHPGSGPSLGIDTLGESLVALIRDLRVEQLQPLWVARESETVVPTPSFAKISAALGQVGGSPVPHPTPGTSLGALVSEASKPVQRSWAALLLLGAVKTTGGRGPGASNNATSLPQSVGPVGRQKGSPVAASAATLTAALGGPKTESIERKKPVRPGTYNDAKIQLKDGEILVVSNPVIFAVLGVLSGALALVAIIFRDVAQVEISGIRLPPALASAASVILGIAFAAAAAACFIQLARPGMLILRPRKRTYSCTRGVIARLLGRQGRAGPFSDFDKIVLAKEVETREGKTTESWRLTLLWKDGTERGLGGFGEAGPAQDLGQGFASQLDISWEEAEGGSADSQPKVVLSKNPTHPNPQPHDPNELAQ